MKKLMYLFVATTFFMLTACSGGSSSEENTNQMVCANTGEVCLSNHSCCIIKNESESTEVIMLEEANESDLMNEETVIKVVNPDK